MIDFAGFPTYKGSKVRDILRRRTCVRELVSSHHCRDSGPATPNKNLILVLPLVTFETSSLQLIDLVFLCSSGLVVAFSPCCLPILHQCPSQPCPGLEFCPLCRFFRLACGGEVGR